jgi:hypothetical protein
MAGLTKVDWAADVGHHMCMHTPTASEVSRPKRVRRRLDPKTAARTERIDLLKQITLEADVEDWLKSHFADLKLEAALIGTQVELEGNLKVDMLAIQEDGRLCVVELKRDDPYREVFIQALDYARLLDGYLRSDLDLLCRKYAGRSLDELYLKHFGRPAPDRLPGNPSLVVVAGDFDEENLHMGAFLKSHRFDLTLIRYHRQTDDPTSGIKFEPIDLHQCLFQATGKMPDCVLEIRFTEIKGYNWRECRAENVLALPQDMMDQVLGHATAGPIGFLLYLNNHGYVAYGTLRPGKVAKPCEGSAEKYLEVPVEWIATVGFEQAIFRSKDDQPPPRAVVRMKSEPMGKWSKLVGLLKYREAHYQQTLTQH